MRLSVTQLVIAVAVVFSGILMGSVWIIFSLVNAAVFIFCNWFVKSTAPKESKTEEMTGYQLARTILILSYILSGFFVIMGIWTLIMLAQ